VYDGVATWTTKRRIGSGSRRNTDNACFLIGSDYAAPLIASDRGACGAHR
jgi:hypothetical protein